MISVAQFKKEISEITYPSSSVLILKGDTTVAADWCLDFLKDEGSITVKDGEIYIRINLQDAFDSVLNEFDWEFSSDDNLKEEMNLFTISCNCCVELHGDHNDEVMAILFWFDKFLGYDAAIGDGIVGLTFDDLKKYYNLYREKVDKDIPVFEEEIRSVFGDKTDRFLKIMGYNSCDRIDDASRSVSRLWETSGPTLKGTRSGKSVESVSEVETDGMKLLYWSWIREACDENPCGYYNGISLSFIDLSREGTLFEIIVHFDDEEKENEEQLLKDLIKTSAIKL